MQRDTQATWCIVERVLETRFAFFLQLFSETQIRQKAGAPADGSPTSLEYFVKWVKLPYDQCTWEDWEDVKQYTRKLEDFKRREEDWVQPRPYIGYVVLLHVQQQQQQQQKKNNKTNSVFLEIDKERSSTSLIQNKLSGFTAILEITKLKD